MSRHSIREHERSATHVDHGCANPNGSYANKAWSNEQTLHVAAMYSNPQRWNTRLRLFNDFRRHMASMPNIRLYVGELAYGNRPFEVTSANCPTDFQFRSQDELWHKENILNLVIQQFDPGWEYGGYCDGDFHWTRHDLGVETIQELQHYDWVQMFSSHTNLGPDHQVLGNGVGYVAAIHQRLMQGKDPHTYTWPGSPGGAWAFRREAFSKCGQLLDTCILGSGDYYMARALMMHEHEHPELYGCGPKYAESILAWHKRAAVLRGNVGYVDAHACHHFHGPIKNRGYNWRWKILKENAYNPFEDIFRDARGVYRLTPDKPGFRDDLRRYFQSRNEDQISLV